MREGLDMGNKILSVGYGRQISKRMLVVGVALMAALCILAVGSAAADAAPSQIHQVKDINPGSGSSVPSKGSFVDVGGTLYFEANDGTNGNDSGSPTAPRPAPLW